MRYNEHMLIKVRSIILGGAIALIAACGVFVFPQATHAVTYGTGSYNKNCYNCIPATTQTNVTLSSGLVVSVNLSNGQVIPFNGFTVVVQPASGQNGTLKKVDFYLDGSFQFSGTPNDVGAVRWLWQPDKTTGTITIKMVITAQDGTTSTQEFTVTIGTPPPATTTTDQPASSGVVSDVSHAVINFVGSLPTPVLYVLPYFLFALLVINIILLLRQTQREISEAAVLQRIINIERQTGLEKNTFVSLASHYLRTPLSIIEGGFDLLHNTSALTPDATNRIRAAIDSLRIKVDSLLGRSDAASQIAGMTDGASTLKNAWKSPSLYLPIVLIGIFALLFNYIAGHVESFSVSQLNLIVQTVTYALIAVFFYQMFRRRQLHRRNNASMQAALAHEQAVNQTRDDLVAESTSLLGGDLQTLKALVDTLPASEAATYIQDGMSRFRSVLTKFAVAAQLKGGHVTAPFAPTSLSNIVSNLPRALTDIATKKGVRITVSEDAAFNTQSAPFVGYVLASLINNAIGYSASQGIVDLSAKPQRGSVFIYVTDNGSGITPQKMSLLFQPFSQVEDAERYTHEGMGFSLYLDKLILTYLGGTISIASKPNVKTTVTVQLLTN